MSQVFKNAARTELDVGISASTTQFTVIDGTIFPEANASVTGGSINQTSGDWFKLVLQDDDGNFEIVYCYAHGYMTHTFTVLRGQEGTTARDFLEGTTVGLRLLSSDVNTIHSTLTLLGETKQEKTVPAAKADALTNARIITLSGAVQANATWDASGALELVTNNIDVSKANGGTLVVGRGGTGATAHTAGQVLVGNGSSAITSLAIDTTTSGTSASGLLITSGAVNAGLALKANLDSPALTGTPTAPTATAGTNTTQLANTAFVTTSVSNAVSNLLGSAPAAALDTLKELGDALGNDPDFAATMTNTLATKVDKVAGKMLSSNDFTDVERAKLANIAEQATKNATDADLRDRSTHTGTQGVETITGLSAALDTRVVKTSDTGAAILPEGTDAERPAPGATGLYVRLSKTSGKPEWYNRAKSEWKPFGDASGELFNYAWHNGPRSSIDVGRVATDGQQLLLLTHPDACQAVWDGQQHAVDESVWQADPTKRNCWSRGDGTSWVRVPDLNAAVAGTGKPFYLRGGADALNGTSVGDAGRNLTGVAGLTIYGQGGPVSGAFNAGSSAATVLLGSGTNTLQYAILDASRQWPVADEFRVKTAYGVMTVRVFTEVSNVGALDAGQLATQLSLLDAKVQNLPKHSYGNKIINGKMEFAQRGTSFPAIAAGNYSLDRWVYGNTSSAVATISQQPDVPSSNEFQNSLRYAVTTADTSIAAGDVAFIRQMVEGYNARDLVGRTFTISFWVRSSKTGIHCVSLGNSTENRSFITEYTVNSANTWEYKTITVSGGLITEGTWDWTNGRGVVVSWVLACGSTYQTTEKAWQTGVFFATANQVNCLDTVGNIFAITGVQLEVGSVATPFEHLPYGIELMLCQRYYQTGITHTVTDNMTNAIWHTLQTAMRAPPTVAVLRVGGNTSTNYGTYSVTTYGFRYGHTSGGGIADFAITADSEL